MTPLTTAQAAERLGLAVRTVQVYCRSGRLKATQLGRDFAIDPKELERFAKIPRKVGQPKKRKD